MKLKQFIWKLEKMKKVVGDGAEVYLSSDSEGNAFGTVEEGSINFHENSIILYPFKEGLQIEDL